MTKTIKTLVAALVIATAATASSYAAPRHNQTQQGPSAAEQNWMDHASQNVDGGG